MPSPEKTGHFLSDRAGIRPRRTLPSGNTVGFPGAMGPRMARKQQEGNPMRSAQLGPWLLAGLIVGPVLGSGIIILPPVVLGVAGAWALPAWLVMIAVGVVFALVFGELSVLFPGDGGVSVAVGHAFGPQGRRLASLYLVVAVLFGPVAVLLTGVRYLPLGGLPPVGVA
ncbi:amino acid permease, partial [Desulfovibrio sp. XJ01]|nr:amino acid permease [Nitratidesulfovibrio liaohensis]